MRDFEGSKDFVGSTDLQISLEKTEMVMSDGHNPTEVSSQRGC